MSRPGRRSLLAPPDLTGWRPLLLPDPRRARGRTRSLPVLRAPEVTASALLVVFLVLQFVIPARLVIGGMGAVGRPSVAVGVLLAFLWVVSAFRPGSGGGRRQPVRLLLGAYLLVQLVGYAAGFDRRPVSMEASAADRWMILNVAMVGVALAVCDGVSRRRDLDRLLRTMVGLAAGMAVVGILQYTRIVDLTQYVRIPGLRRNSELLEVGGRGAGDAFARVAGTANHYIEFGVVLALLLPLAVHFALFSPPVRWQRFWRWTAVVLVAGAIPLSISRSAILTCAVTVLLTLSVWRWRQRYNAAVVGLVGLVAFQAVTPGLLGTIRSLFENAENDPSIQNRISDTARVVELWQTRPWLGRGAGMIIPERYLLLDNQFYVTLVAGGVLGLAMLAAFLLVPYFLARSIRLRSPCEEDRHLAQSLAAAFPAAFLASGTFDSFSFATFVGVLFVLVGAVGALWRTTGHSVRDPLTWLPSDRLVAAPVMARPHPREAWFSRARANRAGRRPAAHPHPG